MFRVGVAFVGVLAAVLGKWCMDTINLVEADVDFNAEWNPYVLLHIPDDGSFDTKEIRDAYRRLALKYHPDKVDMTKLGGQEDKVLKRWLNL